MGILVAVIFGVGLLAGVGALATGQFVIPGWFWWLAGGGLGLGLFMSVITLPRSRTREDDYIEAPRRTYAPPRLLEERRDTHGMVVSQIVAADTHEQATRHLQGTTIQGNRSIVATRIGRGKWDVHIEDWDKSGRGMTRSEGYDPNGWSEDYPSWQKRQKGRRQ